MVRVLKYVGSILLSVLLAGYLLFHLLSGIRKETTLFTVRSGSFDDTVTAPCLLFRETTDLTVGDRSGSIIYSRRKGEKVSADSVVATVYTSRDEQIEEELKALEKKQALLEKSKPSAGETVESLDESISKVHAKITALTAKGTLDGVAALEEELAALTNKRRWLIGAKTDWDNEIRALEQQRYVLLSLLGEKSESVSAPASGYFFPCTEETVGSLPAFEVLSLSVARWQTLMATEPAASPTRIGVLMNDPTWYAAFTMDAGKAENLTVGRKYTARFPDNPENGDLPMILQKVSVEGETALVVFSCSTVLPDFDFSGSQRIELVLHTYTGYKIPNESVYTDEKTGQTSVFIFRKGFAASCPVFVLLSKDGYSIVRSGEALTLYDRVLISRGSLYEGKLIN